MQTIEINVMYDAKEIEFSCGVEMETKQFKDHIVYEIDTNDKVSELGIKTASRMNKVFMPIRKVVKNGKLNIICSTEGYDMVDLEKAIYKKQLSGIFKDFVEAVNKCEESAFLDDTYIDLGEGKIFFDKELLKYRFILIPIDRGEYAEQQRNWEVATKLFIRKLMDKCQINHAEINDFYDGIGNCDHVVRYLRDNMHVIEKIQGEVGGNNESLSLVYKGIYGAFTLYIRKNEFVIGSANDCDGVLNMNPTVSRHHCVIHRTSEGWSVMDLGSSNGTFLSGDALMPRQETAIMNNDIVRISDMDFRVVLE